MKNLIITSILALSVAAPVAAQTQLEKSVGADAGQYTLNELVLLKAEADRDTGANDLYLGNRTINFSASDIHSSNAQAIFAELAAESDD